MIWWPGGEPSVDELEGLERSLQKQKLMKPPSRLLHEDVMLIGRDYSILDINELA
jgi:hypothetical protein